MDPNNPNYYDLNWCPDMSGDYHPDFTGVNLGDDTQPGEEAPPPAHSASKPKKGGRRKEIAHKQPAEGKPTRHTYTPEETDIIVQIWIEETNDPIRGVDQKGEAYWQRIVDRVNPLIDGYLQLRQIQGHWNRVAQDVRMWESVWVEARSRWPSGHSDDMLRDKAQILFKGRSPHRAGFNYWNAWKVLRNNHKFKSMYLDGDVHSSKRTKTTEEGGFTTSASGEEITSSRPIGNKAAKAAARAAKAAAKGKGKAPAASQQSGEDTTAYEERLERSAEYLTKITAAVDKKNELKREELDLKLLSLDTTQMSDAQRRAHEYMVQEMLKRRGLV